MKQRGDMMGGRTEFLIHNFIHLVIVPVFLISLSNQSAPRSGFPSCSFIAMVHHSASQEDGAAQ